MNISEEFLEKLAAPLSSTEDEQCKNAIRMVRDALKGIGYTDDNADIKPLYPDTYSYSLQLRTSDNMRFIKLFVQGSYANNTNVRGQSDVDVAVIQEGIFNTEYRKDSSVQSDLDYGFIASSYTAHEFKNDVQKCLQTKFGNDVERKNKSIKVHGNTYRKDADAVPCIRYKDYRNDYHKDKSNYIGGIVIYPDNGGKIINYPEQHIENGRKKNVDTGYQYKKMVRIIKGMRSLMSQVDGGYRFPASTKVSSFLLESTLWNIYDSWYLVHCLGHSKISAFDQLMEYLYAHTSDFKSYKEANGIKPLCPDETKYQNLVAYVNELYKLWRQGG